MSAESKLNSSPVLPRYRVLNSDGRTLAFVAEPEEALRLLRTLPTGASVVRMNDGVVLAVATRAMAWKGSA